LTLRRPSEDLILLNFFKLKTVNVLGYPGVRIDFGCLLYVVSGLKLPGGMTGNCAIIIMLA
jgi:hypothetical protein